MKYLTSLPNMHCVGDSCVLGSGVFRYWSMTRCEASIGVNILSGEVFDGVHADFCTAP